MNLLIAIDVDDAAYIGKVFPCMDKNSSVRFVKQASEFLISDEADFYFDFTFDGKLYSPPHKPLLVNETITPIAEFQNDHEFVGRFCGWWGFAERKTWEIAASANYPEWLPALMTIIDKHYKIVEDIPGLIAPRILATIINEAFYLLEEEVSTAEQIDMAMKAGTNYPHGPFTWGKKIGYQNIFNLLYRLNESDPAYKPHPLLLNNNL